MARKIRSAAKHVAWRRPKKSVQDALKTPADSKSHENGKSSPRQSWRKIKPCRYCKKRFRPKHPNQEFHTPNCRKRYWDKKQVLEIVHGVIEDSLKKIKSMKAHK